jgi:NAD(P)-dependent dehydrogenase (short-subunit alcohol dehydrogenase family)
MAARRPERGEEAAAEVRTLSGNDDVHHHTLDLASLESIEAFASGIGESFANVHVLVNNAGAMLTERQHTLDGLEATFGVNHLGHFHLTNLLLDQLRASAPARIVNVSSIAHRYAVGGLRFDDLLAERRYNGWIQYGRSKLANLLHAKELARRLEGTGVTANACHPGTIRSGFGSAEDTTGFDRLLMAVGHPFLRPPEKGARVLVHLAGSPLVEGQSGGYWVVRRRRPPSRSARSPEQARRLWDASEALIAEGRH